VSPRLIRVLPSGVTAEYVASSMQGHNHGDGSVASYTPTHTFQSTEQDGTVYVVIGAAADNGGTQFSVSDAALDNSLVSGGITPDTGGQPSTGMWFYKPSQAEVTAGSIDLPFTLDNGVEVMRIFTCEVLAKAASPLDDSGKATGNPSAGPASVTTVAPNAVLVAIVAGEDAGIVNLSVPTANGFTFPLTAFDSNIAGSPILNMGYREVTGAATYNSPTAEISAADDGAVVALIALGGE